MRRRRRNGREYCQRFERGRPTSELESWRLPRGAPPRTGTRVRFLYDAAVFATRCSHTAFMSLNRVQHQPGLHDGDHINKPTWG